MAQIVKTDMRHFQIFKKFTKLRRYPRRIDMLMLYAPLSPWLPILGSLPSDLISLVGLAFAIAGLIRCFKKES